jgi:hypothetical membrane protein
MSLALRLSRAMHDPLQAFRMFEILLAAVCIVMPLFLRLADTDAVGFRTSISNYVYMPRSYIFGMQLTIPAMLFIFNGAVYFKNQDRLALAPAGKWYNIILGASLLGVVLLPHKEHHYSHYVFAAIFFIGNAIVIGVFHKPRYRIPSLIMSALTILTISLHFLIHTVSLFAAEWLSLAVIGIHFILEARGTISFSAAETAPVIALKGAVS